jgi:hypothetical protein
VKTALEAVLQAMISGGWANESDGSVGAPTGHFARVSNSREEVEGIPGGVIETFEDVINTYGLEDMDLLIGHFLVVEDSQGFVHVTEYDSEVELTRAFQELQDAYSLWAEGMDD